MSRKTLEILELIKAHIPSIEADYNKKEQIFSIKIKEEIVMSGPIVLHTDIYIATFLSGVLVGCNK